MKFIARSIMLLVFSSAPAAALLESLQLVIPQFAHDGHIVTAVGSDGQHHRVQVPQGFDDTAHRPLTALNNRGLLIPDPTLREQSSLQVHLHHTASAGEVAVSWTTPTASSCAPKVDVFSATLTSSSLSDVTQSGVTRTYPTALLVSNQSASFQHVVLSGLEEGSKYNYTVGCEGYGTFSGAFVAPTSVVKGDSPPYTFAIFGDMGISIAAHDTVRSLAASSPPVDAVFHIGDLSYARGDERVWNQFFGMIEPVASRVPWTVAPGNHDTRQGDSNGECGLPMLSRFETPRSRAAQPHLLALNSSERCIESYANSVGDPFWYGINAGHARIITWSSDSNLTKGSPQYKYLVEELAKANTPSARALHPWLLLMGHKPMYTASTYGGCINTRGNPSAGEGTEGQLTAELEDLFVKNKVDVSFYGHIHSFNRMFPVKNNGTYVESNHTKVYRSPDAPVHMMVGMSGAGHLGAPYATPDWSAYSEISYGWLRATFANATALHLEFVANGDGLDGEYDPAVHDEVWITK